MYKKIILGIYFAVILFLCFVSAFSQNFQELSASYLKIKNEIEQMRTTKQDNVLLSDSNAPVLNGVVNGFLKKFCNKMHLSQSPSVYISFDSTDLRDYNFYCRGRSLLLGQRALRILLYDRRFEKYFEAILAHEFSHFVLEQKSKDTLQQEIEANTLAFSLIETPMYLVDAIVLHYLILGFAYDFKKDECIDSTNIDYMITHVLTEFVDITSDFGRFMKCSSWLEVEVLREMAVKNSIRIKNDKLFVKSLAFNLAQISDIDSSYNFVTTISYYGLRSLILLQLFFSPEDHPSPKLLVEMIQKKEKTS